MKWAIIPLVLALAGGYALVSYQLGHRVAFKRLPILILLSAAGIGIFALLQLLPTEWEDHAWSVFFLVSSLTVWVFLGILMKRAAQAGDILLDIGRPRGGLVIGVVAAGPAFFGIDGIVQAIVDSNAEAATQLRHLSGGLFMISFGLYVSFLWLKKWSIRERGIMVYGQLLPWEKIKDFHWQKGKPSTLALSVKRRFPWWGTVYVRIPTEKQEAATEILGRNLSPNIEGGSAG
jgi:hypothetical protein